MCLYGWETVPEDAGREVGSGGCARGAPPPTRDTGFRPRSADVRSPSRTQEPSMLIDVKTNPHHTTWERMLATWERADDIEAIDGAWVFDHFYPLMGDTHGPRLEGGA